MNPSPAPTLPRPPRPWKQVLLGLLIFAAGLLTGGGLTLVAVRRVTLTLLHHPDDLPRRLSGHMRHRLHLSDAQEVQVRCILERRQEAVAGLRRRFRPELERELEGARREIAQTLDPRQAEAWDRWFLRRRDFWLPPPPPAPPEAPAPRGGAPPPPR